MNLQAAQLGSSMYMPMGGSIPKTYQPKARQYLLNAVAQGVGGALSDAVMKKLMTQQISPEQAKQLGIQGQVPEQHWYRPNFTSEMGQQLAQTESQKSESGARATLYKTQADVDRGRQVEDVRHNMVNERTSDLVARGEMTRANAEQQRVENDRQYQTTMANLRKQEVGFEGAKLPSEIKREDAQTNLANASTKATEASEQERELQSTNIFRTSRQGMLMGLKSQYNPNQDPDKDAAISQFLAKNSPPQKPQDMPGYMDKFDQAMQDYKPPASSGGLMSWFGDLTDRMARSRWQSQQGPHPTPPAPSSPAPAKVAPEGVQPLTSGPGLLHYPATPLPSDNQSTPRTSAPPPSLSPTPSLSTPVASTQNPEWMKQYLMQLGLTAPATQ